MNESKGDLTEPGDDDIDLVSVAYFTDPLQANVLRACLESHGMRVQVRSDQVEEARKVIAAFERGNFAIDEEPDAE